MGIYREGAAARYESECHVGFGLSCSWVLCQAVL